MKLACLGPRGTFSEIAARKYLELAGQKAQLIFCSSIFEIFEMVQAKEADFGVVPFENSLEGSIRVTLDELFLTNLHIQDAITLKIEQFLATLPKTFEITKIISHPHALAQCYHFLKNNYPNISMLEVSSTAAALKKIAEEKIENTAAIGPEQTARNLGLKIIASGIQDNKMNFTRFFVIGKKQHQEGKVTSIALYGHKDRPGLLHDLLDIFAKRSINLTRIESRPAKIRLGDYIFYLDFEGKLKNPTTKIIFSEIEKQGFKIKIFGTWRDLTNF